MAFLVFRLYAPLASWGEPAVGEERPSAAFPSASAVLGLVAAALGLRRDDETALLALHHGYDVAVGMCSAGTPRRDYQTAQAPRELSLKNHSHRTRADELAALKRDHSQTGYDKGTILSTRDYREDGVWLIAVAARSSQSPPYSLEHIKAKLERPEFTLYFGRKACPPALPLSPRIVEAATVAEAFQSVHFPQADSLPDGGRERRRERLRRIEGRLALNSTPRQVAWPEGMSAGYSGEGTLRMVRKDRLISRRRWQFGDRVEHVWLAPGDVAPAEEA